MPSVVKTLDKEYCVNNNSAPVVAVKQGPGCLVQILWFIFVGWWLGSFAISVAYVPVSYTHLTLPTSDLV